MELSQALSLKLPGVPVYQHRPGTLPRTPYVIVTMQPDAPRANWFQQDGRRVQEREFTLLLTLYGAEGQVQPDLAPLHAALLDVADLLSEVSHKPPLRGVTLGVTLDPQEPDSSKRPGSAVRLVCRYVG